MKSRGDADETKTRRPDECLYGGNTEAISADYRGQRLPTTPLLAYGQEQRREGEKGRWMENKAAEAVIFYSLHK